MRPPSELGAIHPVSLRFLDDGLEERFQREAGAEGLERFRLNALMSYAFDFDAPGTIVLKGRGPMTTYLVIDPRGAVPSVAASS